MIDYDKAVLDVDAVAREALGVVQQTDVTVPAETTSSAKRWAEFQNLLADLGKGNGKVAQDLLIARNLSPEEVHALDLAMAHPDTAVLPRNHSGEPHRS